MTRRRYNLPIKPMPDVERWNWTWLPGKFPTHSGSLVPQWINAPISNDCPAGRLNGILGPSPWPAGNAWTFSWKIPACLEINWGATSQVPNKSYRWNQMRQLDNNSALK